MTVSSQCLTSLSDTLYPTTQTLYSGTAGSSATYQPGPQAVVLWSDQPCLVSVGEGVVGNLGGFYVPATTLVTLRVPAGTGAPWRVSAVKGGASSGTLFAKPVNFS